MATRCTAASSLGIRTLLRSSARFVVRPTAKDILVLRSYCHRWGVPSFEKWNLLLRALTHSSVSCWAAKELQVEKGQLDSASLEFLGDRAIALAVAPRWSRLMLGNSGFALAAARMGVPNLIRSLPRHVNERSALADAYEAIAGAMYLDGGMQNVQVFVDTTLCAQAEEVITANQHLGSHFQLLHAYVSNCYGPSIVVQVDDAPVERNHEVVKKARVFLRKRLERGTVGQSGSDGTESATSSDAESKSKSGEEKDSQSIVICETVGRTSASARLDAVKQAYYILQNLNHDIGNSKALFSKVRSLLPGTSQKVSRQLPESLMEFQMLSLARDSQQRERSRVILSRNWCVPEPLCRASLSSCLEKGRACYPDTSIPSVDEVLAELRRKMRQITRDCDSLPSIAVFAETGHRYYWLHLARHAYESDPTAKLVDLQEIVLTENANLESLAITMGGVKCGMPPLLVRPCGRRMLFVVLGIFYDKFGENFVRTWMEGGRLIREEKQKLMSRARAQSH